MNQLINLFLLCCSVAVYGQDTIPFHLNSDSNIIIKGVINSTDSVDLMLHTAANVFSIIKESALHLESVHFENKDSISSWGGNKETAFSANNTLQLTDKISFDSLQIWLNDYSGKNTDGKIGLNLFADKVVELNFEKQIIVWSDSIQKTPTGYQSYPLYTENDFYFIEGQLVIGKDTVYNKFLIHSGYAGGILLDDAFSSKNNIFESVEILNEQDLKDSYGNVLKTYNGILNNFILGNHPIEKCKISFFGGSINKQKMSVIGTSIIGKFNWIFDFKHNLVYLKRI
ncbi:MAG TPA: hypothetical protein PKA00_18560 [Saprospiraceae bacterium]|nr:hypothetical protein [Saprospiraceae bacterium]HMQ84922.1 hypothetical protein [Saprospiraceae bacterium]